MSDTTPPAPKIEFPCQYPIKIICDAGDDLAEQVLEIVRKHDCELDAEKLEVQDSKNGRFMSLRLVICATGEEQLQQLHNDLKATGRVHMVL